MDKDAKAFVPKAVMLFCSLDSQDVATYHTLACTAANNSTKGGWVARRVVHSVSHQVDDG